MNQRKLVWWHDGDGGMAHAFLGGASTHSKCGSVRRRKSWGAAADDVWRCFKCQRFEKRYRAIDVSIKRGKA